MSDLIAGPAVVFHDDPWEVLPCDHGGVDAGGVEHRFSQAAFDLLGRLENAGRPLLLAAERRALAAAPDPATAALIALLVDLLPDRPDDADLALYHDAIAALDAYAGRPGAPAGVTP